MEVEEKVVQAERKKRDIKMEREEEVSEVRLLEKVKKVLLIC